MATTRKTNKKKTNKFLRRNIIISAIALLLVGGLVLTAVLGFADFLSSGEQGDPDPAVPAKEDYLSTLEEMAASLEQRLEKYPDEQGLKLELADIYLELAAVHGGAGEAELRISYAQKSEELLNQAAGETRDAETMLKLAMLAYYQDDRPRAEEYYGRALALDEDNAEVHFSYGLFLASGKQEAKAREHLEKVLLLEPEESYLAALARLYLEEMESAAEQAP